MKIILFDTILERHLAESLQRALRYLGHEVDFTDLILHGHSMIEKEKDLEFMWQKVKEVEEKGYDLFISFRPMNLTVEMVSYLGSSMKTAIWLSDDPVLYKNCYKHVVDAYDIVLHCGYTEVLKFYEDAGHVKGFNFPFWTDHISFPVVFNKHVPEMDLVFLGNMNGQVRRKRYLEFGALPFVKKVYGLVDSDPYGIHGGFLKEAYLHTNLVSDVLARAKVGVSIPQFFKEYNGLDYDFPELAGLGYFQFPSRIIQYAASGLPIAAVGDSRMQEVYPAIHVQQSIEELTPYLSKVANNRDFAMKESAKIISHFQQYFSALSRAEMLISLCNNLKELQKLTTDERAKLFLDYSVNYNIDTY